jgi:hypothetical protein
MQQLDAEAGRGHLSAQQSVEGCSHTFVLGVSDAALANCGMAQVLAGQHGPGATWSSMPQAQQVEAEALHVVVGSGAC